MRFDNPSLFNYFVRSLDSVYSLPGGNRALEPPDPIPNSAAKLKKGVAQTPSIGHALIGYVAALLSRRENRAAAAPGLPGAMNGIRMRFY
jgi:hypothetical protein